METSKALSGESATYSNQGVMKVYSRTIEVETDSRTDLINLTDTVRDFVQSTGITDGHVQLSCLHTTAALLVNEWQEALLADIKSMIEGTVPRENYYRHNDPQFSDCDRSNADSHLRNVFLGHNLTVLVSEGKLVLGTWQSVIFAEFDGPNRRRVFLQVFGI